MPIYQTPKPTQDLLTALGDLLRTYTEPSVMADVGPGEREPSTAERVKQAVLRTGAKGAGKALGLMGLEERPTPEGMAAQVPGVFGTFIGPKAKTFNREAAQGFVREMRKVPAKDRLNLDIANDFWSRFKTFLSPDGRLRQEIPDTNLAIKRLDGPESEVVELVHPQLEKAYPGTTGKQPQYLTVSMGMDPSLRFANGAFAPNSLPRSYPNVRPTRYANFRADGTFPDAITLDPRLSKWLPKRSNKLESEKSTLVHELQHFIQNLEGFEPGGNLGTMHSGFITSPYDPQAQKLTAMLREANLLDGYKFYRNLAGEAEARAASQRLALANTARNRNKYTSPLSDYDVELHNLTSGSPITLERFLRRRIQR
jgi:hypothetical protein